ncbi:MAG: cobyrinate a,c-diamide synthase [Geminicoccus sp.]|nr:cobyrinate a,c-diamide synthase [Geminicoccus sp.]
MARGLILAAPSSGSGKTSLTFGLLAALRARGTAAQGFKTGPDYIDPQYHRIAADRPCPNLDPWAMRPETILETLQQGSDGADLCLIEGVMGLFDGVPGPAAAANTAVAAGIGNNASTAALANSLDLPVVLIVDAKGQSQSVAALVRGFADFDPSLRLAGVILNRVGSDRHRALLSDALTTHLPNVPVLGAVPRLPWLEWPGRHLGLTLPDELPDMPAQADRLAQLLPGCVDLDALQAAAAALPESPLPTGSPPTGPLKTSASHTGPAHTDPAYAGPGLRFPAGARVAIARDDAFSFVYPHWLRSGAARVETFSPLANEAVPESSDFIFLPGGYPELQAERLAAADVFLASLREHHARATPIYGECGGYMVLGQAMTVNGTHHTMAGLLPVVTHYSEGAARRLGYRSMTAPEDFWAGPRLRGHEFHASTAEELEPANLFNAWDSSDKNLGRQGHRNGNTLGSYLHIIDRA